MTVAGERARSAPVARETPRLVGYRQLLATAAVRRLLLSSLVARLPLGMTSLALLLLVRSEAGSFATAGLAVGAYSLACAFVAPVQGALIDRFGPRLLLLPLAVAQAIALAVLVGVGAGAGAAFVVVVSAAGGALNPPVSACVRTLWMGAFDAKNDRASAYAMDATTQETLWVLGPLLVALLVALASPAVALLFSAAVSVLGTAFFASTAYVRTWPGDDEDGSGATRRTTALASPGLRVLLACAGLTGIGWGAIQVGLPALAVGVGSRQSSGVLLALWGLGSVFGGLFFGSRRWRLPMAHRYVRLLWLSALFSAPLVATRSLLLGLGLSLLAGVTMSPLVSCQWALVGEVAPAGVRSEAFAWDSGLITGGMAGGAAMAGIVVNATGPLASFVLACGSTALAAIIASAAMRSISARPGRIA
jgi:MFS family permease